MERIAIDDPVALDRVVAALRAGEAVVIPTETVYGVAALPQHEGLLREAKGRPADLPIAVLVADGVQAEVATGAALPPLGRMLAAAFWPGPLTLVLATAEGTTLGVRCPDHAFVRAVAAAVGPLSTTSANRHGEPTPVTAADAAAALAGEVVVVIDGGEVRGTASTVVDVTGPAPVILREGPIGSAAIHSVVG